MSNIDEWQDDLYAKQQNFVSFNKALNRIHNPSSKEDFNSKEALLELNFFFLILTCPCQFNDICHRYDLINCFF